MSKLQTLRALVIERLAAAAEEISVLFERATAEYEEELSRSEEENQRTQQLLDRALSRRVLMNPGLNQDFTQTPRIKEEFMNTSFKSCFRPVPESSAVCVKSEEPPLEQLMETEADGENYNQVQSRDRSTKLSPNNKSAPETTVHNEDKAGPDGAERKKHQCSVCNKRFESRADLQRHIRVHTGEKPYGCQTCEKTFTQKGNLDAHMRTHTGEKPFTCPTCETKFAKNSHLKRHKRTHTGERPYSCPCCEKAFAHKYTLDVHMRTHTGEKPFPCPVCEKTFAQKSHLRKHKRIHRGQQSV
uniref:C2H2-type domain-containing protein n=1 Tax=Neogobius melanostomus TaxID=47308 RepID=A0A8C6SHE8_9GOBI